MFQISYSDETFVALLGFGELFGFEVCFLLCFVSTTLYLVVLVCKLQAGG